MSDHIFVVLLPGGHVLAARSDIIRPRHSHSAKPFRNRHRDRLHSAEELPKHQHLVSPEIEATQTP